MKFVKYVEFPKETRLDKTTRQRWANRVYSKYGNKCYICGILLNAQNKTIDHIHPLSMWGSNNIENLRPCCQRCNVKKDNSSLYEFGEKYVRHQALESFHKRVKIPDNLLE